LKKVQTLYQNIFFFGIWKSWFIFT
jgi:hypothetical protein